MSSILLFTSPVPQIKAFALKKVPEGLTLMEVPSMIRNWNPECVLDVLTMCIFWPIFRLHPCRNDQAGFFLNHLGTLGGSDFSPAPLSGRPYTHTLLSSQVADWWRACHGGEMSHNSLSLALIIWLQTQSPEEDIVKLLSGMDSASIEASSICLEPSPAQCRSI